MGCRTVVIENRYVDADYRSDFAAFWSRQFVVPSPFTRRVHFFRSEFAAETLPDLPADPQYMGYSVVRPSPHLDGHVGRTVLAAPDRPENLVLAAIEDEVSLFGNRLTVRGVPFVEQDGEFLRCAHAAIWVCHYTAVRRGLVARTLTAELRDACPEDALGQSHVAVARLERPADASCVRGDRPAGAAVLDGPPPQRSRGRQPRAEA